MPELNLPSPLGEFSRCSLLFDHFSPLHPLPRITATVSKDHDVAIWVKREDCNSGLAFGGNKLRKLEYVLPEVLAGGFDTIVTCGGTQSNSMRQVAAAAAKYGIRTSLFQRPGSVNWKEPDTLNYRNLGNIQATQLMAGVYTHSSVEETMSALTASGKKPYYIPPSTSTHPLGGLGFARFAFELLEQERQQGVFFDAIIVAAATGSTMAGIVAGFKLAAAAETKKSPPEEQQQSERRKRRLIAFFVGSDPPSVRESLLADAQKTAEKLGLQTADITEQDYEINSRFNAGAYGQVDEPTIRAMKLAASLEGLILDPVYTAKAFAGMLAMIESGEFSPGTSVLFLHTGGQAVLSAYSHLDLS